MCQGFIRAAGYKQVYCLIINAICAEVVVDCHSQQGVMILGRARELLGKVHCCAA